MSDLPTRRWARLGPLLLRLGVTAGVLAALALQLPLDELTGALARTPPGLWLAVVGGFLLGHGVTALKWRLLLHATGVRPGVNETLRAHGAGLFANLCLPSIVGGDVVRAGLVIRRHGHAARVAVGGLADRVLDTAALTLLAATGALLAPGVLDGLAGRILALAAFGCLAATLGALAAARWLDPAPLPPRLAGVLEKVREALDALGRRPVAALGALVLSLAVQSAFVLLNAQLGAAIGIALPLAAWLLAWPLAKLVALVPVSLGGIGVREVALAGLLVPFAVAPALAVAQSLLWETVLVAAGLVAGGAALALGARPGDASVAGATP